MKKWTIVLVLACAQFIMVLDSTVMNVSISQVVKDLNTNVSGLQAAITFYTLTMSAFMLTGGKLGDKLGRLKAFRIGAVVYALGSFITAISPSLLVLFAGWSVIEGLGAVLVIPAIAALIASNYKGKDRIVGYTLIGAASGVAVALGPLIGGYLTTYYSWRYVFVAETIIMALIILYTLKLKEDKPKTTTIIDKPSVVLSASGMALLVLGILQSKTWGWVTPKSIPQIGGVSLTPFGISLVAYLVVAGVFVLRAFYLRQIKLTNSKKHPLLDVSMLNIKVLRSGLAVLCGQYLITAAIFFVLPIYLQMVLGYDALTTGKKLFPLSVAIVAFSAIGSRLSAKYSPKSIVKTGQIGLVLGALLLTGAINPEMQGLSFALALFTVGAGLGLLASQIGNVNMSSVEESKTSEVGGLQGTFQNFGSSLGTAIIGSVMIASLTTGFVTSINNNPTLSPQLKTQIQQASTAGVPIASSKDIESAGLQYGLSPEEASSVAYSYESSQVESLRSSMFLLVVLALATLVFSKNIPSKKPV